MKCPKCNAENREKRKFCSECGAELGWICSHCGFENEPNERFCGGCGKFFDSKSSPTAQTTASIPTLEKIHSESKNWIPDILAQKYLSAEQQITAGENRPITALFADISGFTPLSATKSSEAIFHLVQDCFKQLVSIVAKYEGSISGFRGDGLLALFGAPILHENDAERAILAAIDMREAIKVYQLQVSIGINTAMMTVGEIQTQLHNEYTAYGTDINLAKRLQESAKPGQILVGAGSHRLTRRAFDFDIISNLAMKGFTQPVTAYSVQQVKTHPEKLRGIEGLRARMIGREHEFTEAKDSVDEWLSGHGQIVSVIGEAGIGKSRLVSELKTYLSSKDDKPFQYIEGRCVSIGQPISYWPFIDILKTYFNLSEGDDTANIANKVTDSITQLMPQSADETLPLLGQLLSIKYGNELDDRLKFATPEQVRHQTLMRLRDIFETLAKKQPLLLILEDLHWSDDLSLDLISLLMDELANTPLMLLCIYRPEHDHRVWQLSNQARRKCMDRFTEITLKLLSSIESRELIESLLEIDNLPETIKKMIMDKSEGNPFFIEEVVRSLIEQGMIYQEDDRWIAKDEILSINVPDTIQSVILSRVDRLQSEAKYILQCASVIGRLFKHKLLDHLTHQERELNHYISEFEDRELVYQERMIPELEYAFKHALTQETTYQSILERKRKEFHLQVAQGMERLYQERLEEYYEELADHYSKSDDIEKAVEYLIKSGEKAKNRYSNEAAESYFQSVLKKLGNCESEHNEWKLKALKSLGELYLGIGKLAEAESFFSQAIELAKSIEMPIKYLVGLYWYLGKSLYWQSKYDEMVKYGQLGIALMGEDNECLETILIQSILHWGLLNKGRENDWKKNISRSMELAQKLPYSTELADVYINIIESFWDSSDGDALAWSKELEHRAKENNDLRGVGLSLYYRGHILRFIGDIEKTYSLWKEALRIFEYIGDPKYSSFCHETMAWFVFLCQGDLENAEKHAYISLEINEKVGHPREISLSHYICGNVMTAQKKWEKALTHYTKSLHIREKIGNPFDFINKTDIGLVSMYLHRYQEALSFLGKASEFLANTEYSFTHWFENYFWRILTGMEKIHSAMGTYDVFIDYCKQFMDQNKDSLERRGINQLYLEPLNPSPTQFFEATNFDKSWVWTDQYGDCVYKYLDSHNIKILAANGRDMLWQNFSAPRFMREISGDFAIEVCVLPVSEDKPQIGGLLIWKDKTNFLHLDKGVLGSNDIRLIGHEDTKPKFAGRGLLPTSENDETHLRLERSGDEFTSYCSIDGENWFTCGKMTIPMEDPIQVGIHAIGMIDRTIYCGEYKEGTATLFRNFRIWTKG